MKVTVIATGFRYAGEMEAAVPAVGASVQPLRAASPTPPASRPT